MKGLLIAIFAFIALSSQAQDLDLGDKMIKLQVNGKQITLLLDSTKAANDFYNSLPISIFMENENFAITGRVDSISTEEASLLTIKPGGLYYYPTTKRIYFVHTTHIGQITAIPIARQRGTKTIFDKNAFDFEVSFSKIE